MYSLVHFILVASIVLYIVACNRMNRQLANQQKKELAPVTFLGTTYTKADQPRITRTGQGFQQDPIPGIPIEKQKLEYKTYVGASN